MVCWVGDYVLDAGHRREERWHGDRDDNHMATIS